MSGASYVETTARHVSRAHRFISAAESLARRTCADIIHFPSPLYPAPDPPKHLTDDLSERGVTPRI
jgi:hypothetical protein